MPFRFLLTKVSSKPIYPFSYRFSVERARKFLQRQEETRSKEYNSIKAEIVSKLRQLGLSSYGARAFLAVLESQPVSATTICKNTSIPDSKIYYALKELEDKKLIMVQHGTPSTYRTFSSKQILSGLESGIESEYRSKIESARKLEKSLSPW